MRYLGVPTCPYCKKRVNLIRTWSLKRQGEYLCPRCGGASNIYLSPLIYVLALLAVFSSGVLYFFHKYVLDDITLETGIYVFIPFAGFFLFSLFMVYLEKPVIKKVSRAEYEKKRRFRSSAGEAPAPVRNSSDYFDDNDFAPRNSHRPGPAPQQELSDSGVVNQQAFHRARQQAEIENTQKSQRVRIPNQTPPPQRPRPQQPAQPQAAMRAKTVPPQPKAPGFQSTARPQMSVQQRSAGYAQGQQNRSPVPNRVQGTQPQQRMTFAQQGAAARSAQAAQQRTGQGFSAQQNGARPVSGLQRPLSGQPSSQSRYDNTAYVQRKIQEAEREAGRGAGNRR